MQQKRADADLDVKVHSTMGENIKKMLFFKQGVLSDQCTVKQAQLQNSTDVNKSESSKFLKPAHHSSNLVKYFQKLAFEFDTNAANNNSMPTLVSRSKLVGLKFFFKDILLY